LPIIFLFGLLLAFGCAAPLKPVKKLTPKSSGKIAYQVPKVSDLTEVLTKGTNPSSQETIYGKLMMPDTVSGKIPAVVIMHASGGVFPWREIAMAQTLNKNQIAAFIPYSFEARGVVDAGKTAGTGITFGMRLADAFSALKLLATHPDIDPQKIGIMGYSSGGVVSLLSGDKAIINKISPKGLSFAAHVNIYTTASIIFKNPQPSQAPMLFLMGEKDDICPLDMVMAYAEKLGSLGGKISTIVYPGAYHVFDSPSEVRYISHYENDGKCQFPIDANGMMLDMVSHEKFREKDWPEHISACSTMGVHFGRDQKAAERYMSDVTKFFKENLEK
jgi:dienelactone hydrolase